MCVCVNVGVCVGCVCDDVMNRDKDGRVRITTGKILPLTIQQQKVGAEREREREREREV